MVCSRDIPQQGESGRERTLRFVHESLRAGGEVQVLRVHSVLEQRSLRRVLALLARGAWALLTGRPLPLQSLLFLDARDERRIDDAVRALQPDAVVFDGVRSGVQLAGLRARWPGLRIVCDFDDLMSRRMALLRSEGQPVSLGYLKRFVPVWIQRHLLEKWLAGTITGYEARALLSMERRILRDADAVVLVSSVDAEHLRQMGGPAEVVVIPPVMPALASPEPAGEIQRFVFIGSDALLQNRKSIEYLVALWRRACPATVLHVYGRQTRQHEPAPNVEWHGFVDDVAQVYTPGSVLLAPSFVSGGVKTKVLEAMAHGVVAVGTAITFEGIEADAAGLVLDDAGMADLVAHPDRWASRLADTGRRVLAQACRAHAPERQAARWRSTVWPLLEPPR